MRHTTHRYTGVQTFGAKNLGTRFSYAQVHSHLLTLRFRTPEFVFHFQIIVKLSSPSTIFFSIIFPCGEEKGDYYLLIGGFLDRDFKGPPSEEGLLLLNMNGSGFWILMDEKDS
jgi:hypothetical protein